MKCNILLKVLLILWTAIDPIYAKVISPDPIRPSQNYTVCTSDTVGYVFLGLLALYKVVLMI